MKGKYEKLRIELESIYYADYIIDKLYKRVQIKAMDYTDDKWLDNITEAINKLCRFQIYYDNNYKILYNCKDKDVIIKCVIDGKTPNSAERHKVRKFYENWERNKVGI